MTKLFCSAFCLALIILPLAGCGGVETEPVGVPMAEDGDAGMEGIDTEMEP